MGSKYFSIATHEARDGRQIDFIGYYPLLGDHPYRGLFTDGSSFQKRADGQTYDSESGCDLVLKKAVVKQWLTRTKA